MARFGVSIFSVPRYCDRKPVYFFFFEAELLPVVTFLIAAFVCEATEFPTLRTPCNPARTILPAVLAIVSTELPAAFSAWPTGENTRRVILSPRFPFFLPLALLRVPFLGILYMKNIFYKSESRSINPEKYLKSVLHSDGEIL